MTTRSLLYFQAPDLSRYVVAVAQTQNTDWLFLCRPCQTACQLQYLMYDDAHVSTACAQAGVRIGMYLDAMTFPVSTRFTHDASEHHCTGAITITAAKELPL